MCWANGHQMDLSYALANNAALRLVSKTSTFEMLIFFVGDFPHIEYFV